MVYVSDRGSEFDAPIEFVWKYMTDDVAHDSAHKTTRKPKFEKFSDITFIYSSERLLHGKWAEDRMRITMFPPVSVVIEWLEGVLGGSKLVYVYSPKGSKTGIDVYGEFTSPTLSTPEVESVAREFLDTEFEADAPVIRAAYQQSREQGGHARP